MAELQTFDEIFDTEKLQMIYTDLINLNFASILIENEAIVAGGSLLHLIELANKYDNNLDEIIDNFSELYTDTDIYVNKRNAANLIQNLLNIDYNIKISPIVACPYDQSFFYKNKILGLFRLKHRYVGDYIDIIIIDDEVSVQQVVTNFDLSFCELWYDGRSMYSYNKEDVINKRGILKPDYVNSLIKHFNKFILKRIEKYSKRGYNISYSIPLQYLDGSNIDISINEKLLIANTEEEWVIRFLLKLAFKPNNINNSYRDIIECLSIKNLQQFVDKCLELPRSEVYKFNQVLKYAIDILKETSPVAYYNIMEHQFRRLGFVSFEHAVSYYTQDLSDEPDEDMTRERNNNDEDDDGGNNDGGLITHENDDNDDNDNDEQMRQQREHLRRIAQQNLHRDDENEEMPTYDEDEDDNDPIDENGYFVYNVETNESIRDHLEKQARHHHISYTDANNFADILLDILRYTTSVPEARIINNFLEGLQVVDFIEMESYGLREYLELDVNNIIFITKNRNEFNAYGAKVQQLRDINNLFVKCNDIDNFNYGNVDFNNWYLDKLLGMSGAIHLDDVKNISNYLNEHRDELVESSELRMFYLEKEPIPLTPISTLRNVIINSGLNIFGNQVNIVSGTHCGEGTTLDVYKVYKPLIPQPS